MRKKLILHRSKKYENQFDLIRSEKIALENALNHELRRIANDFLMISLLELLSSNIL